MPPAAPGNHEKHFQSSEALSQDRARLFFSVPTSVPESRVGKGWRSRNRNPTIEASFFS
jgi:hypothetical protein